MNDETPLVDEESLLVSSLKQRALMKIVELLIRPDLENYCFSESSVSDKPPQRISDSIEQLCIPKSCQNDIRSTISRIYRHIFDRTIIRSYESLTLYTVKFNICGDMDLQRTFDDHMEYLCRSRCPPRQYLYEFLEDACRFYQEQCIHKILCELAKRDRFGLEPSLRNATLEVEVAKSLFGHWYSDMRFVIEDFVDLELWKSFVTMLNNNLHRIRISFDENILRVCTFYISSYGKMALLWPKMTTIVKYEHAEEMFKVALDQSDTCLLVQTLHYLNSTNRMHLIKTNLVRFLLCFLTHPYYRHFIPDLQLVEEDLPLVQQENELRVFEQLVDTLASVGDYTNISNSLFALWKYVSSREKSVGDHVLLGIKAFVTLRCTSWDNSSSDARKVLAKMHEIFAMD